MTNRDASSRIFGPESLAFRGERAANPPERWGIILAGGDGTRLRSLTRAIAGDERPKQFCPILGRETLLDQTRRRAALPVPPGQTLVMLTGGHRRFYEPLLAGVPQRNLVVQPQNKGTAPAILYALLRLAAAAPTAPMAIFPSDHYVSDDARFMAHAEAAFQAVRARPETVVLLGIAPDGPEEEYGWIEPADPLIAAEPGTLSRVRRFWEKPSADVARTLWARGCLWNSFVMVGGVPAFLGLIASALPDLYEAFAAVRDALGGPGEEAALRRLYARLPESNFSREVLAARPAGLAVLPVVGVRWSDWGEPGRVLGTLARIGVRPQWAEAPLPVLA